MRKTAAAVPAEHCNDDFDHRAFTNDIKRHVRESVRTLLAQWGYIKSSKRVATTRAMKKMLAAMGGQPPTLSDAQSWALTMEIIMKRADQMVGHRGASLAAYHRLVNGATEAQVSERILHLPVLRCREIVLQVTNAIYMEALSRGVTENYRDPRTAAELEAENPL